MNNSGDEQNAQPSFKRRRIALACKSCRTRKSRCNGGKPSCNLCIELGFECVYEQPAKAVGATASGRGQTSHDERLKAIEDTIHMLLQRDKAQVEKDCLQRNEKESQHNVPTVDSDGMSLAEEVSIFEDEHGAVDGMATTSDPEEVGVAFFGPSSNIAFIREISSATKVRLKTLGATGGAEIDEENEAESRHPLLSRAPSPQPPKIEGSKTPVNVGILPPTGHAIRLIKLFFKDTGLMFPYVYEQYVIRSYHAARGRNFTGVSRPFLALLNVIFAFSTYITGKPGDVATGCANDAQVFYSRARVLSSVIGPASIDTIQTLLLMCQFRQGTQSSSETYLLHGSALRLAIQLGLHSKTIRAGLHPLDAEIWKRTWLACVYFDSVLAMTLGRPTAIPNSLTASETPLNCSLESLDPLIATTAKISDVNSGHVCLMTVSLQLCRISNDVLRALYGSNFEPDVTVSLAEMLQHILGLESRLQALQKELPHSLLMRPWSNEQEEYTINARLSVVFRLRLLNVRILLHRPLLAERLYTISTSDVPMAPGRFLDEFASSSVVACRQTAREIIEIVSALADRPYQLLGAPWFSCYFGEDILLKSLQRANHQH